MKLSELKPAKGSNKKRFKVGRGPGSGLGKTCGKGQKGAGARKSPGVGAAFEGGQMPLQRRLPKRGFRAWDAKVFQVVNLSALEKHFQAGAVTPAELAKAGLIKDPSGTVKVLGGGSLTKAFQVKASAFSASAKQALEAAGGKAEVA